jgi:O-succinylbenzoic acid--CoA ligase
VDKDWVIDWRGEESHLLLNPRMPREERRRLESFVVPLPAHVWLATSGTTGSLKLTALSKKALLASAASVNRHLSSGADDVWVCVLPTFHVGGLGIHARAFLSGARVLASAWDPARFAANREMTLASLVPAQVADLVTARLEAPPRLRAIVVGGGALSEDAYRAAAALGWPLLPSYGMTECGSQIATAKPGSRELVLLDAFEARIEKDGRLAFRGEPLLTGYGTAGGFVDPKRRGWLVTDDLGSIEEGRVLRVTGRRGDFIKIGGESVDLARLDAILSAVAGPHAAVAAVPDERLGHVIHLFVVEGADADTVAAAFAERVHPFERPRQVHRVAEIPRSPLGKLIRTELLASLE